MCAKKVVSVPLAETVFVNDEHFGRPLYTSRAGHRRVLEPLLQRQYAEYLKCHKYFGTMFGAAAYAQRPDPQPLSYEQWVDEQLNEHLRPASEIRYEVHRLAWGTNPAALCDCMVDSEWLLPDDILREIGADPNDEELACCGLRDQWSRYPAGSLVVTGLSVEGHPLWILTHLLPDDA